MSGYPHYQRYQQTTVSSWRDQKIWSHWANGHYSSSFFFLMSLPSTMEPKFFDLFLNIGGPKPEISVAYRLVQWQ